MTARLARMTWGMATAAAVVAVLLLRLPAPVRVAQRPAMGFETWYEYGTGADEADVLRQARLLVTTGLAADGYTMVALDDGWMAQARTASGALTWDPVKFPHGIPWLAAQLHAMGLKFGIYEAIGTQTCEHYPGSWAHYAQDARTFAAWGVDFVKVDECGGLPTWATAATVTQDFEAYGQDLRAANPAVVYSVELPLYARGRPDFIQTVQASSTFVNQWRVTEDESGLTPAADVEGHLAADLHLHAFAGPGHWNDLDMVLPGYPGWTLGDEESQLSVWAEEGSPLLISADLGSLDAAEISALANPHMIAIDQSGQQAAKGLNSGHIEALVKPDPEGGLAVLLANTGGGTSTGTFTLAQVGVTGTAASGYNVWTGRTTRFSAIRVTLSGGQAELLRVQGNPRAPGVASSPARCSSSADCHRH